LFNRVRIKKKKKKKKDYNNIKFEYILKIIIEEFFREQNNYIIYYLSRDKRNYRHNVCVLF